MINLFSGIKTREYISHFLIISMVFVACFFFGPTRLYADPPSTPYLSVEPSIQRVAASSGTTSFEVSTSASSWTSQVTSGGDWLTISKPDNWTISCSYKANSSTGRNGIIRVMPSDTSITPQYVTVSQAGLQPDQPILSVSPTTLTVGIYPNYSTSMVPNYSRVLVSNTGTGALNWTAQVTSGADWLQIRSGASGTNSGEVNVGFLSNTCYDTLGNIITCPSPGQALYGQDGNYSINPMSFTKLDAHGNDLPDSATTWYMVRDNVTRLIWEMKNNKDGKADYSNPTMQTMNTPGTTATRLPTAAMPEHKVLVRIPNPFLKL